MVVCRYFLQGYCKFGDHCRYQHYQDNRSSNQVVGYRGHSRSWHAPTHVQTGRTSSPVSTYHTTQVGPGPLNPLDLAEAIKEDVVTMEGGGQWPLSCYSPSKDFGSFPGFHDTSMEEVRYEAYQAQVSGTFDQYVKKIENLIQATRMKWGMLKNPTGQVMSVIEKMAGGQGERESRSPGLNSFSFAASFNSSAASQPHTQQLQQQPQQPSGFSLGGNTAFVVPQSAGGMFSTTAPSPTPPSPSNFTFTLVPTQQQQSGGGNGMPFGTPHTTLPASFGGAAPVFGQSGGLLFGGGPSPPMAPPSNAVQQPMATGFFGAQPGAEKQGSVFGVAPSQTTVFGSSAPGYGMGAFQPNVAALQSPQQGNVGIYSPLSDLTEAEREEFTAVTFTLGCVPLRPPPSELCV